MIQWLEQTMIIERASGVCLYCLVLAFFYIQIKGSTSGKAISTHFNWYLLILGLMGFLYIPATSADIYRWRQISASWMGYSLPDFFTTRVVTSDTPLGYLLIYLCQKTGINGILPGICALIFYLNVFHIFKETWKRESAYSASLAISLLFFLSAGSFQEVISGVRCFVAFSVVTRYIYDEVVCGKSLFRSIVPYILAVLMHTAVLPLIAVRLFALLFEKRRSVMLRIANLFALLVVSFLALRFGNDYINASFTKASNFIYNASSHYSYRWEYLIGGIQYLIIGVIMIKYYKNYRHLRKEYDDVFRIMLFLSVLEIVFVISYSIFHRFLVVSSMLCIPILTFVLNREIEKGKITFANNIKIVSMIILLLACIRGNLCAYKFFVL